MATLHCTVTKDPVNLKTACVAADGTVTPLTNGTDYDVQYAYGNGRPVYWAEQANKPANTAPSAATTFVMRDLDDTFSITVGDDGIWVWCEDGEKTLAVGEA